jgi:hypothetical protein
MIMPCRESGSGRFAAGLRIEYLVLILCYASLIVLE